MKKKVNIFGKSVSVFVVAIIAMGLVSAALLTYYGVITGSVVAAQSVLVDGKNYQEEIMEDKIPEEAPGGEMFCFKHYLKNDASVETTVYLENDCSAKKLEGGSMSCEGADKYHYVMPEEVTLNLCSKETSTWTCNNQMTATLTFDPVNPHFVGTLITSGLNPKTEYALIYYADKPGRFVDWGGDNPGKVIVTFQGSETNGVNFSINTNLGMNLPSEPDANIDEYCYAVSGTGEITGDNYNHCHGAKLWIVPTGDLTGDKLTNWNPSSYLFETDLIVYFDCNIKKLTSNYPIDEYAEVATSVDLESGEEKPFFNCYDFAINIRPGTYTFTTKVTPESA